MKEKIYLLPGTMCNAKLWDKLSTLLNAKYDLIHIPILSGLSLDSITDSLDDIFQEPKVNLVGFSLGGYIAAYFSTKYPHRINKIFIISNTPCPLTTIEINERQETLKYINDYGYKGITRQKANTLLDKKSQNEELIDTIMRMDMELGEKALKSQLLWTTNRDDLFEALSKLSINMTFFYNTQDPFINTEWLHKFTHTYPHCTTYSNESNGHMLPLEEPLALSNHLINWLKNT
ncbi:alpha/beta fold hydrolase [Shewanella surugensis]|uniref:Alpha/beta hydrolase n=1 Tax=Shewanella surugensis TaxID=212020 RepID=A0ABT0LDV6_9GAMM|nr:alpha/beta hydrolase [Shewanella surugensis]MCL1125754.1 alpha/beta hydrolase [Shewanella surugensis]